MSNLAEPDNVSETNSNDSIPIVIDDDRQKDYESQEDIKVKMMKMKMIMKEKIMTMK